MAPGRAVLALALPTIAAQVVGVLYSVVDIIYVGQLGDPAQVAAVRIAFPPFLFFTALSNLLGIGASSMVGRALGSGDRARAAGATALALWATCLIGGLFGLLVWLFRGSLLPLLGAGEETYGFTSRYLFWVILVGGVPNVLSVTLAHLLRSEGHAKAAGQGVMIGGLANIALAPLFIFTLGLEVEGAGIAVLISNIVSVAWLLAQVARRRGETVVSLSAPLALSSLALLPEMALVGLASFTLTSMATVSNATLNMLASGYGSGAIAALGIAKQIDQLIFSCSIGLAQGVLPLIAYNFASGDHVRLRAVVRSAVTGGMAFSAAAAVLLALFASPVTSICIADEATASVAAKCVRIIAVACPISIAGHLVITGFQACGAKWRPLLCAFLRKGSLDLVMMVILSSLFGLYGIAAAIPAAEAVATAVSMALFIPFVASLGKSAGQR